MVEVVANGFIKSFVARAVIDVIKNPILPDASNMISTSNDMVTSDVIVSLENVPKTDTAPHDINNNFSVDDVALAVVLFE